MRLALCACVLSACWASRAGLSGGGDNADDSWWLQEWTPPDDNPLYYLFGDNGLLLRISLSDGSTTKKWRWRNVHTPPSVSTVSFRAASKGLDPKVGFVAGTNGTILRTRDGGHRWTVLDNLVYRGVLNSVAEATTSDVFAGGEDGTILRSTNGGDTWEVVRDSTTQELCSRGAADAATWVPCAGRTRTRRLNSLAAAALPTYSDNGNLSVRNPGFVLFAAGTDADAATDPQGQSVLCTVDAGKTWRRLYIGNSSTIRTVSVDGDGRVFAVDADSNVFISTDGGQKWLKPSNPLRDSGDWVSGCTLWGGGKIVLCVGQRNTSFARLVYGRVSAAVWADTSASGGPPSTLVSPSFASQSAVAVVEGSSLIAVSPDFGEKWAVVPLNRDNVLPDDPASPIEPHDIAQWRLRGSVAVVAPPFPSCHASRQSCPLMRSGSCPVGYFCPEEGQQFLCVLGSYCSGEDSCEQPCPGGHYCPTPSQKIQCPSGHFCRAGSTEPTACFWMAQCPTGSDKMNVMAFAWLLTLSLIIVIAAMVVSVQRRVDAAKTSMLEDLLQRAAAILDHDGSRADRPAPARPVGLNVSQTNMEDPGSIQETTPAQVTLPLLTDASFTFRKRFSEYLDSESPERDADCPAAVPPIELRFEDLTLQLRSGRRLLNKVTGRIRPMSVTAVMGPSGAGKTSLLNALLGRLECSTQQTGEILCNGEPMTDALRRQLRQVIGFVPQEDIMHRDLSCREMLAFNAKLRLPKGVTDEERRVWVASLIRSMRLTSETAQAVVGDETQRGVSGGERKRINIGMEAVALPSLLFLDEPTSGLDATLCCHIMQLLRAIRDLCKCTVVAVIHQPRYEVFKQFDDVLLLGQGGSLVYNGPAAQAEAYFTGLGFMCGPKTNPADFLIDVVDDRVKCVDPVFDMAAGPAALSVALAQRWESAGSREPPRAPEPTPPPLSVWAGGEQEPLRDVPGWCTQFTTVFTRCMTQTYLRQWRVTATDMCLCVLGGCVLGIALPSGTYPDMHTLMGLTNFILCLFSHQAALRTYGKERPVFWREASGGCYSVSAYFIAKDLAQLPAIAAFPGLYIALFYPLTEPLLDGGTLYATLFLIVFVCYGSGYLHSVALPYNSAQLAVVLTSFGMLVLSGFTPQLSSIWSGLPYLGWFLTALSPIRWGFEAQLVTSFNQLAEIWRTCYADHYLYQAGYQNVQKPIPTAALNLLVLVGLGLLVRVFTFLLLVRSARLRR